LSERHDRFDPAPDRLVMLTAGAVTQKYVDQLTACCPARRFHCRGAEILIPGFMRRAAAARAQQIGFCRCRHERGGIWDLPKAIACQLGGEKGILRDRLRPVFETLAPAPDKGWAHMGPTGAGHFTKHGPQRIEYGIKVSYAEGFGLLKAAGEFNLDLHKVAETWRFGSVIRSWLLDLTASALESDRDLSGIKAWVSDSGEGRWTVFDAIRRDVPAPVITLSLLRRIESRQEEDFAAKLLAVMRNQFGGHELKKE